jgi:hypothetical protein
MQERERIASAALLGLILIFTVIATGSQPKPVVIGVFAQYLLPALLTIYLLVVLYNARAIIEVLASFLLGNRRQEGRGQSWVVIIGYGIGAILILIFFHYFSRLQNLLSNVQAAVAGTWAAFRIGQGLPSQQVAAASNPYLFYYVVFLFVAIVLVSFTLLFGGIRTAYSWARGELPPLNATSVRQETMQVVHRATRDLTLAGDYRDTILNCYLQMCYVLSLHGFRIGLHETASEFCNKVSSKLGLGCECMRSLTFLFEEARYSSHDVDDSKRAKALSQLESLERSLGSVNG